MSETIGVTDANNPYYGVVSTTGVIVSDDATLLSDVQEEWSDAFGSGLNVTSSTTPQGAMIAAETLSRSGVIATNAVVANQINPNQAGGTFLDAICSFLGLERVAASNTTVPGVILAGVPGSPIAAGTQATTPLVAGVGGDAFALLASVILDPVTGQAIGTFVAVEPGPVPAPTGAWHVSTDVLGWETVTNPAVAVPGVIQQQDEALRQLRRVTLAKQGSGFVEAATSAVSTLPSVEGFKSLENTSSSAVTIDGVALGGHSVWYCVDGGDPTAVATALLLAKGSGAGWNGAQSVGVTEPFSGQIYNVQFDVPSLVPLLIRVTCSQSKYVGDPTVDVVTAVLNFGSNTIADVAGFTLGDDASPFEIANGVMQFCPGLKISKVEVCTVATPVYGVADIPMMIYQKPTIISGNVAVVVTS